MKIDFDKNKYIIPAINALKTLNSLGNYETYIVGGAVRDLIQGKEPIDVDFVTNIPMDIIEDNFSTADIGASRDFGILCVIIEGEAYEIAQFRTDSESSDSRHPDDIVTEGVTVEMDSNRRDLTMNALYLTETGEILDFHNGIEDIKSGNINFVGDANERLQEDVLRLFRVFRFSATSDIDISFNTFCGIQKYLEETPFVADSISVERFTAELIKVAKAGGHPMAEFIMYLNHYGILNAFLPEIAEFNAVFHHYEHHPEGSEMRYDNVWAKIQPTDLDLIEKDSRWKVISSGSVMDHVLSALSNAQEGVSFEAVLAILFHDIGKPSTAERTDNDNDLISHSFLGHCGEGETLFRDVVAPRLKLSGDLTDEIAFSIKHHLDFFRVKEMSKTKNANIALNPYLETLKAVAYADDASRGKSVSRVEDHIEIIKILDNLRDTYASEKELKEKVHARINGYMIMNLRPDVKGAEFGEIISRVKEKLVESDFMIDDSEIRDIILTY